jgi:hypothetical protein
VVWTLSYEHKIYADLYRSIAPIVPDTAQRRQLALYMVKRYKVLLPNGIGSVPKDSLIKISKKISEEFSRVNLIKQRLKITIPWTPKLEQALRASIAMSTILLHSDSVTKNRYCDCAIAHIKKIKPDSLQVPIPDSVFKQAVAPCKHLVSQ